MRCPKCAYISFDHLSSCSNCGREFTESETLLQGTGISVVAPFFLTATVGGMVDHVGASESGGGDFSKALTGDEVDFQLEPDRGPTDDGEPAEVDLVIEEEGAEGGSELEAGIDLDLGVDSGAEQELTFEPAAEPEGGGEGAESDEQISLVLAADSEPDLDLVGEESALASDEDDSTLATGQTEESQAGDDEVVIDFAGLDDLDHDSMETTGVEEQSEPVFSSEEGYEDLFTDLDLFEESETDLVVESPESPADEESGLTLEVDEQGEKPGDAETAAAPEPAVPGSGLVLEIEDE